MMDITRNVILDLLPLYMADEVSADTRALVEKFIENDQEFAEIVKTSAVNELRGNIPIPLDQEDEMKAYKKTRWIIFAYILIAAVLFSLVGVALLASFFISV